MEQTIAKIRIEDRRAGIIVDRDVKYGQCIRKELSEMLINNVNIFADHDLDISIRHVEEQE